MSRLFWKGEYYMGVLTNLEPVSVFKFFEEICGIPHGSGNMGRISDYLVDFARKRNLEVIQDELKNVIIIKEAAPGYEDAEPVIIQGHMDMVAVKKADCDIDFSKDGLDLRVDGDYIYAEGTSLGGDDGIAVAYGLALLDAEDILHPRLEVVITTDEEIGLLGAGGIDLSMLKGRTLINLDSEDEGIFLTSCAGGGRVECRIPVTFENRTGAGYEISLEGLLGGHSGVEINKERGNANVLLGRILTAALKEADVSVVSMGGGIADNVIAKEAKAVVVVEKEDCKAFEECVSNLEKAVQGELSTKDPGVRIRLTTLEEKEYRALSRESMKKAAAGLFLMPGGVQAMSAEIDGLVQTSLNLGILSMDEEAVCLDFSVRSSVKSEKEMLVAKIESLAGLLGGTAEVSGEYPAWEYKKDSRIRGIMVDVYREMYGKEPVIEAIHAGLECGILSVKAPGLDCISLGPDMLDIHSVQEKLSISSTKRVWEFLLEVLKRK